MKITIVVTALFLASGFSAPSLAASEHGSHGAMASGMKTQSQVPVEAKMVDGLVKKIDKSAGKVTIAHGPLTNLGMDMAMTMAFRVKDAAWLDQMKEGGKIRFIAEEVNGALTVVKFEPVK